MQDIDLAVKLQDSITRRYPKWWSMDLCLELVREVWSIEELNKELHDISVNLYEALNLLDDLTTEEFSHGKDKPAREALANAARMLSSY